MKAVASGANKGSNRSARANLLRQLCTGNHLDNRTAAVQPSS